MQLTETKSPMRFIGGSCSTVSHFPLTTIEVKLLGGPRVPNPDSKIDPIRDRYYRPVQRAESSSRVLFYVASALSIGVLLVDKVTSPQWYDVTQIAFVTATVAMFAVSMAIRLYLSPRPRDARLADFLSSAFSVRLTYERTQKYYNNEEAEPFRRMGAQLLENTYFTQELTRHMCRDERIVTAVWLMGWLIALVNRASPLDLVVCCSLVLFSEELLLRILRLEWIRGEVEKIRQDLFRRFQTGPVADALFCAAVIEALVLYENAKASSGITISSKLFDRKSASLTAQWDQIRSGLNP